LLTGRIALAVQGRQTLALHDLGEETGDGSSGA
jgi:hypothetical protein